MNRRLDNDLRQTAWLIGVQTAGLLMACLLVVGAVLYASVVRSQDQQLSQALATAAGTAGYGGDDHDGDNHHDLDEPRGGIQWVVVDVRGTRDSGDLPSGLPDTAILQHVGSTGGRDQRTLHLAAGGYEVLTLQRGDDTVQVAASRFELHQERERILGALALAGSAGLALATLAAAVLARRAVRPMAEALEQQRRFVADAGHELRTPLTLLSTRAQLLARRLRDPRTPLEQQAAYFERDAAALVEDSSALVEILEDLLTAADVRTPIPQEPVDLGRVALAVVAAAQPAAEEAGVTLTAEVGEAAAVVPGSRTALGRAIAALVDNAIDHAQDRVEVRVTPSSRQVVVEVLDNGPGIASAVLPRLFDRFAGDRGTPPPNVRRHFGLGLALVSEIATRHSGQVSATNKTAPASGAVLRLTLPVQTHRFKLAAARTSGLEPLTEPLQPTHTLGDRDA